MISVGSRGELPHSSSLNVLPPPPLCPAGKDCYVNIEYESNVDYDLQGVVIAIPLPHMGHAPTVNQVRYGGGVLAHMCVLLGGGVTMSWQLGQQPHDTKQSHTDLGRRLCNCCHVFGCLLTG
jgi:hypothetical protein